jgi:hypothetical protein
MKAVRPWAIPLCNHFICLSVCVVLVGLSIARAEGLRPSSQRQGEQKVDDFPRQQLPEGQFDGWCGFSGAFLLTKGQLSRGYERFVYARTTSKPVRLPMPGAYIIGCDASAEYLIFSDVTSQGP